MLLVSLLSVIFLFAILRYGLFSSALSSKVNTEKLRRSLRVKWLAYYRENRHWLNRLQIWVTYEGQRRPTSSFIVATLSTLDPQFNKMLPFIVEFNRNPDQIVVSLELDFDPEKELEALPEPKTSRAEFRMLLPAAEPNEPASRTAAKVDESCEGVFKKDQDSYA
jgi:hypothetical protein